MELELLKTKIDDIFDEVVALRRDIHMHPELSGEEVRTAELVSRWLTDLGILHETNVGGHGLVATIGDPNAAFAVGIRADVQEVTWETWVSDVYRGRNFQATVSGIAASDMTAREMLARYASENSKNFIGFSDGEYDDVVARAAATLDPEEQLALYKRAQEILSEQAASVWLQDLCDLAVLRPGLTGMTFYATYVLDMSTIHYA